MKRCITALLILCSFFVFSGCTTKGTWQLLLTPAQSPTASPTLTQKPSPTATSVQPTATPSNTPTSTATATSTPTSTPIKTPNGIVYASKSLGIQFTLPNSWQGRYTVKEKSGSVSVYFKPAQPYDEIYDGFLFIIEKKTAATEGDKEFLDGFKEITIKGVTYYCGGPTDVTYEGPENDLFRRMNQDIPNIYKTIRAI